MKFGHQACNAGLLEGTRKRESALRFLTITRARSIGSLNTPPAVDASERDLELPPRWRAAVPAAEAARHCQALKVLSTRRSELLRLGQPRSGREQAHRNRQVRPTRDQPLLFPGRKMRFAAF